MTTQFLSGPVNTAPAPVTHPVIGAAPENPYILHEFFAGGGMARLGFGAGWRCSFANEIDTKKGAVYAENFGSDALRLCGVETLTTQDVPDRADVAWASFPCTDLSVAGHGKGFDAARSGCVWSFLDLIEDLKAESRAPRILCLENVPAMLAAAHIGGFVRLLQRIVGMGYHIGTVQMDAAGWIPQSRNRLFIVAIEAGLADGLSQGVADPKWHPKALRDIAGRLPAAVAAAWHWFTLPEPQGSPANLGSVVETCAAGAGWDAAGRTGQLIADLSAADRAFLGRTQEAGKTTYLVINRRTRMTAAGKKVMSELKKDGLAGCLRTAKGGSSRQVILEIQGERLRTRPITAREAARLMGIPEEYRLPKGLTAALNVSGDGVAVPVVSHLVTHLFEPVLAKRYSDRSAWTDPEKLAAPGF